MSDWEIKTEGAGIAGPKEFSEPRVPPVTYDDVTMVLVDGDLIAYRCAAATDGTYYKYGDKHFRYHKDALSYVMKRTIRSKEDTYKEFKDTCRALIVKDSKPEPVENAIHNMQRIYKKAKRRFPKAKFMTYLTSDILFRDEVSSTYKASREGLKRPTHLKACKDWLKGYEGTHEVEGYEADDLMAMAWNTNKDAVVMSLDKDLKQLHGRHYDFAKDEVHIVGPGQARLNFWTQTLVGDKVDDIQGLHGVGPKTAEKILADLFAKDASDREYYEYVLNEYIERSEREEGETGEAFFKRMIQQLGKNCRLLYLVRTPGVFWDVPSDTKVPEYSAHAFMEEMMERAEAIMKEYHVK